MSVASVHFAASADALATRVGDEIVLVDLKTDRVYSLNRTAARIWESCAPTATGPSSNDACRRSST